MEDLRVYELDGMAMIHKKDIERVEMMHSLGAEILWFHNTHFEDHYWANED